MHNLIGAILLVGIIVLLGWGWAGQTAIVYDIIYRVKDLFHGGSNVWSIPVGEELMGGKAPLIRMIVQIVVSVLLAAVSLFIVFSREDEPKERNWAYGTFGILIGFWVKAS